MGVGCRELGAAITLGARDLALTLGKTLRVGEALERRVRIEVNHTVHLNLKRAEERACNAPENKAGSGPQLPDRSNKLMNTMTYDVSEPNSSARAASSAAVLCVML